MVSTSVTISRGSPTFTKSTKRIDRDLNTHDNPESILSGVGVQPNWSGNSFLASQGIGLRAGLHQGPNSQIEPRKLACGPVLLRQARTESGAAGLAAEKAASATLHRNSGSSTNCNSPGSVCCFSRR